jgi:hypothetical protein
MSSQTETTTQTTEETTRETKVENNCNIPPPPIKIPVDIVPENNESFTPISVVIQPTQYHRRYPILIADNNVERRYSLFRITGRELYCFYFKVLFFLIIFIVGLIIIFNYFKSK